MLKNLQRKLKLRKQNYIAPTPQVRSTTNAIINDLPKMVEVFEQLFNIWLKFHTNEQS